jgi:hypothetical protein
VAVTYYDFRNNDAKPGLLTDYWAVFGKPTTPTALTDVANWGNELRLTDTSFDLEKALDPGDVPGLFLGDYEGLKAVGNDFVATFCEAGVSPTDPKSIFFRRISADASLEAASLPTSVTVFSPLTSQQLQPLVSEALARWAAAGADVSALKDVTFQIADLPGAELGLASGHTITIDANAAGWGWFVDPTPHDDSEFTTPGNQSEQYRMDLLTVLEHELGHVLGYSDADSGLMDATLAPGIRETPAGVLDLVFAL